VRHSQRRQARLAAARRKEPFTSTFVLLFLLAFSDELLYLVGAAVQPAEVTGIAFLLGGDCVLLALIGLKIWRIRQRSERRGRWTVWLYAGVSAAEALGTDVLIKLTYASDNQPPPQSVWSAQSSTCSP